MIACKYEMWSRFSLQDHPSDYHLVSIKGPLVEDSDLYNIGVPGVDFGEEVKLTEDERGVGETVAKRVQGEPSEVAVGLPGHWVVSHLWNLLTNESQYYWIILHMSNQPYINAQYKVYTCIHCTTCNIAHILKYASHKFVSFEQHS